MKRFGVRTPLVILLAAAVASSGCSFGTRFVFSSTTEMVETPSRRGLEYEEVWFRSADGVRLNGWYVPGSPERPLVLFFHGNAANISHRVENLLHLHSMGFPVFIFDYRGFGRSEGWATGEGDLLQDARGALAWLARKGWTPPRMIYFGRSMGAGVATAVALEAPPAGIILESPFTNLAQIARKTTPVTYALFGWWSLEDAFDNMSRIGRLTAPLLIFHGRLDAVVPPDMSSQLFARAHDPKQLIFVEGAGHSDAYLAGGEAYRQAWLAFASALRAPGLAAAIQQAAPPAAAATE